MTVSHEREEEPMKASTELATPSHTRPAPVTRPRDDAELSPWVVHGGVAGALGAAIVAVFFLAIDVAAGRPFWTPTALGSAFFRGEALPLDASPVPALIAGYTAMHATVFVAFGLIASVVLASEGRRLAPAGLGLAALLFLAFETAFFVFTALFDPALIATYGFGNPAAANLLAAGAMAAYLTRFVHASDAAAKRASS
jgi:hypothetical protein